MSQSTLAVTKGRYASAKDEARRLAALNLSPVLGVGFHLSGWTNKVREAYTDQWCGSGVSRHPCGGWNWPELMRRFHSDLTALGIAV